MKQIDCIKQLEGLFSSVEGLNASLLIGSFGRNDYTNNSDIDFSLWVDDSFSADTFISLVQMKFPSIIQTMKVSLRQKIVFCFPDINKLYVHREEKKQYIVSFLETIYQRDFFWNLRDIGMAYKHIKPQTIFRSSTLTNYQHDKEFQLLIARMGINKIIDLRSKDKEYDKYPYAEENLYGVRHMLFSIDPCRQSEEFIRNYHANANDNQIAYRHFAVEHKHVFKSIFEEIAPINDITVIHCTAGKDRTGCVVALIALFLGENIEDVCRDYLTSEMDTDLSFLKEFLNCVNADGGVEKYLLSCGISQERLDLWKKVLTSKEKKV